VESFVKKVVLSTLVLIVVYVLLSQNDVIRLNAFTSTTKGGEECGISRNELLSLVMSINHVQENFLHLSNATVGQMWWGATLGLNDSLEEPLNREKLEERIVELRALRPSTRTVSPYLKMPDVQKERNAQDFLYFVSYLCETGLLNKDRNHMSRALERAHKSLNDPYSLYLSSAQREAFGVLSLSRETVQFEGGPVFLDNISGNVYLLAINSLEQQSVGKDVREALDTVVLECPFPHAIIDLRNNRGGFLETTIEVLNNFLSNQAIAYAENRNGVRTRLTTQENSNTFRYRSLTILVNHKTASGAEIIVAALREYGAVVVGNKTYGKGVGQNTALLPNGGSSSVTQFRFYSPSGNSWNGTGIEPDIQTDTTRVALTDGEVFAELMATQICLFQTRKSLPPTALCLKKSLIF
jgi:C-terminal processing protease CtpA/Prc